MLSTDISFSKVIPWSFVHANFIGLPSLSWLFPIIDQTESALGMSIFLSVVTNPLSIKYPSSIFLGFNNVTLTSLSSAVS